MLPREDDGGTGGSAFGLDGGSSSFTLGVLCVTATPLAVPVLSLGDGAGLLLMSSSSSEVSTTSSFTRTLLLVLAAAQAPLLLLLF